MEKIGYIEIKISGSKGNLDLTPDIYDIREIISVLENAENLLFPSEKKDRPLISYKIENGSVNHVFKTHIQHIISFNAILGLVLQTQTIDFLDSPTAKAIEEFQHTAKLKDYTFLLRTSIPESNEIKLDRTTNYIRTESLWADAEFYFYGKLTDAGGKGKANIHVSTDDFGTIIIDTPISFLEKYEANLLYKTFGIRAVGKQHSETGEIDKNSFKFKELVEYQPKYDEKYLTSLRNKAKKNWVGSVNPETWLEEIRGGYDA